MQKGVILLQETHSTKDDLESWSNDLGYKILLNDGTSNSRGTLIGISKLCNTMMTKKEDFKY